MAVIVADAGMGNASDLALDGQAQQTIVMLGELMPVIRQTDESHQHKYLAQIEVLGDLLSESGSYDQAAMAYSAGKTLARKLELDPNMLSQKRSIAQAKARRERRAAASDDSTTPAHK